MTTTTIAASSVFSSSSSSPTDRNEPPKDLESRSVVSSRETFPEGRDGIAVAPVAAAAAAVVVGGFGVVVFVADADDADAGSLDHKRHHQAGLFHDRGGVAGVGVTSDRACR
mmetsp:Transcript_1509/g.3814  ORF Transcript_1509/g.3814 Transcript_1509/m.3814 type:complete len:112 (-) Transcript_1509:66-401(-)